MNPLALLKSNPYTLIAIVVALVISFGSGYFIATSQAENKLVTAAQEAYAQGTTAQAKYDAAEFAAAQADYQKRLAANQKRDTVVAAIEQDLPTLVPEVAACSVSADAMKRLNEVGP